MAIFTTLCGEIHNSIQHKLPNSMEVDSVGIIAILSMSYITTRVVKTQTSVAKIPRVSIEHTKRGKNCYKILSVYKHLFENNRVLTFMLLLDSQVQVIFQHYVISNEEKYFPRCDEFLPERWLQESGVRHAFASLPFGYGRRMCLGRRFADLEILIVVSKVSGKE